jgi:hypothetical protein
MKIIIFFTGTVSLMPPSYCAYSLNGFLGSEGNFSNNLVRADFFGGLLALVLESDVSFGIPSSVDALLEALFSFVGESCDNRSSL